MLILPIANFRRADHSMFSYRRVIAICLTLTACADSRGTSAEIDYRRDVKTVLSRHCYRCHGPLKQESNLRVDTASLLRQGGKQGPAIIPGKSAASRLIERIVAPVEERMPPEGDPLTAEEIALLRQWIDAGATAPEEVAVDPARHWAFQVPIRPEVPRVATDEWARNPIDAFLAQEHKVHQLTPRPMVPKHVLLRRVYLDLIGLPPTRRQLHDFLSDDSPDAYEKVVEVLLSSPHFGERWGRHWLDVWRYSDWYGFLQEVRHSHQHVWRWRDWTVAALNADRGYDQIVTCLVAADEQNPFRPDDLPATGFLVRNRDTDSREAWMADAVEHTAKAFLGLTLGCARCHDHMSDPISQVEYYRFRALFEPYDVKIDELPGAGGVARVADVNLTASTQLFIRGNDRNPNKTREILPGVPSAVRGRWEVPQGVALPPLARIPALRDAVHAATLAHIDRQLAEAEVECVKSRTAFARATDPSQTTGVQQAGADSPGGTAKDIMLDDDFAAPRSDVWKSGPGKWNYRSGKLLQETVGGTDQMWIRTLANHPSQFSVELRLRIVGGVRYRSAGLRFDASDNHGHGVYVTANEATPALAFYSDVDGRRLFHDALRKPFPIELGQEVLLRADVRDQLVNVYLNGRLSQVFRLATPRRNGGLELWTTDASTEFLGVRLVALPIDAPLEESLPCGDLPDPATEAGRTQLLAKTRQAVTMAEARIATLRAQRQSTVATAEAEWFNYLELLAADASAPQREAHETKKAALFTAAQRTQRAAALREAEEENTRAAADVARLAECRDKLDATQQHVLAENEKKLAQAKEKLTAARQASEQPETMAYAGLPAVYSSSSGRRLALARWIASDENPLTARVAVNHLWLRHFGQPLVTTVFDFGLAGQSPTHPELLDWLAMELMHPTQRLVGEGEERSWQTNFETPSAPPWSMKHLHRMIVTSRAYRSDTQHDARCLSADPDNRWLWRMVPRRLEAEVVRDSVLAVCGQLDPALGGPDIPSNEGLQSRRRSLYFRTNPDLQMQFLKVFDAASPAECYQRTTSIVPQQALALANSELTLRNGRRLAAVLHQELPTPEPFVAAAFEQILSREPSGSERNVSLEFLRQQRKYYEQRKGDLPVPAAGATTDDAPSRDPELRARELLIHALLNHSDFVTFR